MTGNSNGMSIRVMAGASAQPGLDDVAAAFLRDTGHPVEILYNTGARGRQRIETGEPFDVIVLAEDSLKAHLADRVEAGTASLGSAGGIGVVVRIGAPLPDIASADSMKRELLAADAVLFTSEMTGQYIEKMIERLGIREQVMAKAVRSDNPIDHIRKVAEGRGRDIGFLPFNAARRCHGRELILVGPLPPEIQYSYQLVAATLLAGANREVARQFVEFCGGPGRALLAPYGFK